MQVLGYTRGCFMITEVIFDVETKKLFSDIPSDDPADLGVSVVSVYKRILNDSLHEIEGIMKSFWDPEANRNPLIDEMWEWFEKADRIIGFNSKHFDVPALKPYYTKDLKSLNHFDIMDFVKTGVGRKLSLDLLAQYTLGKNKIDKGTNAVYYWAKRDQESMEKLMRYCEEDVRITTMLYDEGLHKKQLKYLDRWNNVVAFPVDFSYPKKIVDPQMGLF